MRPLCLVNLSVSGYWTLNFRVRIASGTRRATVTQRHGIKAVWSYGRYVRPLFIPTARGRDLRSNTQYAASSTKSNLRASTYVSRKTTKPMAWTTAVPLQIETTVQSNTVPIPFGSMLQLEML